MNDQLRGRINCTHSRPLTGAPPQTCSALERSPPPVSNPGPASLLVATRVFFEWPHGNQPLAWLTCWRKAVYLRTTSGLEASRCLKWRSCRGKWRLQRGRESTPYISLYPTKARRFGTSSVCHTCTHSRSLSLPHSLPYIFTERWCPKEQDWHVAPAQFPEVLSVNSGESLPYLFFIAPTLNI